MDHLRTEFRKRERGRRILREGGLSEDRVREWRKYEGEFTMEESLRKGLVARLGPRGRYKRNETKEEER